MFFFFSSLFKWKIINSPNILMPSQINAQLEMEISSLQEISIIW